MWCQIFDSDKNSEQKSFVLYRFIGFVDTQRLRIRTVLTIPVRFVVLFLAIKVCMYVFRAKAKIVQESFVKVLFPDFVWRVCRNF